MFKIVQYFIHLNLSIALLSLYIVFCFGIDSTIIDTTSSKVIEKIIIIIMYMFVFMLNYKTVKANNINFESNNNTIPLLSRQVNDQN